MRILHTSDLHIGRSINEVSLLEDQRYILKQIVRIAVEEAADIVVIAGDIYDRSIPSAESVEVLDNFLYGLSANGIQVIMISGNHDSPERLAFARRILCDRGLYIAGCPSQPMQKITMEDCHGKINFFLLPFVRPSSAGVKTSQEAVAEILGCEGAGLDRKERNILVTHYFVTDRGRSPVLSESESSICVGGIDDVDAELFREFDYVALGHIHRAQKVGKNPVFYSGTPMKYSFSEVNQKKGIQIVTFEEKGNVGISFKALEPLHDMRKIRGKLKDLVRRDIVAEGDLEDYIQATLTDQEELIDPLGTLRSIFPNLCQLILERRDGKGNIQDFPDISRSRSLLELYEEFYELLTDEKLDKKRKEFIMDAVKQAEGGD